MPIDIFIFILIKYLTFLNLEIQNQQGLYTMGFLNFAAKVSKNEICNIFNKKKT